MKLAQCVKVKTSVVYAVAMLVVGTIVAQADSKPGDGDATRRAATRNEQTIQKYMEGFRNSDHGAILSCLTDDVEWVIPGMFRIQGKEAFDKEIENPAFVGKPVIRVSRLIEEGDVVVAEGTVRANKKSGEVVNLVFCDVFEMREAKVKRLISYLMEVKDAGAKH
jgi:uncharacterized protein